MESEVEIVNGDFNAGEITVVLSDGWQKTDTSRAWELALSRAAVVMGGSVNIPSSVDLTYFPEENTQHFELGKHQG